MGVKIFENPFEESTDVSGLGEVRKTLGEGTDSVIEVD